MEFLHLNLSWFFFLDYGISFWRKTSHSTVFEVFVELLAGSQTSIQGNTLYCKTCISPQHCINFTTKSYIFETTITSLLFGNIFKNWLFLSVWRFSFPVVHVCRASKCTSIHAGQVDFPTRQIPVTFLAHFPNEKWPTLYMWAYYGSRRQLFKCLIALSTG